MSVLVKKEIRLLLPAWIAAMLLIFAPIPVSRLVNAHSMSEIVTGLTAFGVVIAGAILGLAGFGRELSARTFSLLLAQPAARASFWRAKLGVLLVSLVPVALFLGLISRQFIAPAERGENLLIWFVAICVAVTGGLWTTLLFRQIIAAFWISMLVPFAILMGVMNLDEGLLSARARTVLLTGLLLGYSAVGYWFARWQFRHAQDTAWTGGNISLDRLTQWLPRRRAVVARVKTHPLRALFAKELQFQQINFLLAGLLLLLQIGAQLTLRFAQARQDSGLVGLVEGFWIIWIIMPLIVGASAIAEERKFGTLGPQLCLPVSRAWQFATKVCVTLVCGTLLGALVPVALSFLSPTRGASGIEFIFTWTLACACLALVGLYASSLTSQMLQGFGAAVGLIVTGALLGNWLAGSFSGGGMQFSIFGYRLWQGPLVLAIGAGVMLVTAMLFSWRKLCWVWIGVLVLGFAGVFTGRESWHLLVPWLQSDVAGAVKGAIIAGVVLGLCPALLMAVLAARNFQQPETSFAVWRRNATTWLICLILTGVLTTLVYNRAWEFVLPLEPRSGPAKLSGPVTPTMAGFFADRPRLHLLPDGRLCAYESHKRVSLGSKLSFYGEDHTWQTIEHPKVDFLSESNWVAIASTGREVVGVKSDGSLWSAPFYVQTNQTGNLIPVPTGASDQKGLWSRRAAELNFQRADKANDWKTVACGWTHCVALKQDGSLWGWGHNRNGQLGAGEIVVTNGPIRIGTNADWLAAYAGPGHTFAVNRAGDIWKWGEFATDLLGRATEKGPVKLDLKLSGVRSVASFNNFALVLDTEGNLWGWGRIPSALLEDPTAGFYEAPRKLRGADWSAFSLDWAGFAALKRDGTLWSIAFGYDDGSPPRPLKQLGKRTDWIAVSMEWNSVLALARDGDVCRFGEAIEQAPGLLAPTRRVTWSLNLLEAAK